jgi:hypothetical protein
MRWTRHVAHMVKTRNARKILVGRPERKILLGKTILKQIKEIR